MTFAQISENVSLIITQITDQFVNVLARYNIMSKLWTHCTSLLHRTVIRCHATICPTPAGKYWIFTGLSRLRGLRRKVHRLRCVLVWGACGFNPARGRWVSATYINWLLIVYCIDGLLTFDICVCQIFELKRKFIFIFYVEFIA